MSLIPVSTALVMIMKGSSMIASCFASFVLNSGVMYHLSMTIPLIIFLKIPIWLPSSTVTVPVSHISSNVSAITSPTSGFCEEIVAICAICSFVLILVEDELSLSTMLFVNSFMCLDSWNMLISSSMCSIPSLIIASVNTIVDVVPSPASLLVRSAISFIMLAPISSYGSLRKISFATDTQSFVTIGVRPDLEIITFLHFGHIVTFTASDTFLIPANILSFAGFPCSIIFVILLV